MPRTRNDDQRPSMPSSDFMHRRRPLGVDETFPAKADLVGQIIALNKEAKRLRAQRPARDAAETQDKEDLDGDP
jgi:hypothetical protein